MEILVKKNKKSAIVEKLHSKGLLKCGSFISKYDIQEAYNFFQFKTNESYVSCIQSLRKYLINRGVPCKTQMGGIYIFPEDYSQHQYLKSKSYSGLKGLVYYSEKVSSLNTVNYNSEELKKHAYFINTQARFAQIAQKQLMEEIKSS